MKILFPFVGDNIGGSHLSSLNLIKNLNKKKYKTEIIIHEKGKFYKYLKVNNIRFQYHSLKFDKNLMDFIKKPMNTIKNIIKLRRFIITNNYKIIHGNDLRINFFWSLASFNCSNFIWHQRTLIKKNSKIHIFAHFFSKYIICISNNVKNTFAYTNSNKVKKIYNSFPKENKILFNKKNNKIVILLCSKLIEEKNVKVFFQVINEFNKKKNNFNFWILGDGKLKNYYKSKFKKNKNVKFLGFRINTKDYYRIADILVAPSLIEAFGRTIIEALNNGTYVIASNNNSFKEIVTDNKLISFANNNFLNYIKKIEILINNRRYLNKKDIQNKFQKKILKKFTYTNVLKVEKLYDSFHKK